MNEEMYSVTGDTEDTGWLPLPRPDFGSQPLTDRPAGGICARVVRRH
jgi:hypothetical protein